MSEYTLKDILQKYGLIKDGLFAQMQVISSHAKYKEFINGLGLAWAAPDVITPLVPKYVSMTFVDGAFIMTTWIASIVVGRAFRITKYDVQSIVVTKKIGGAIVDFVKRDGKKLSFRAPNAYYADIEQMIARFGL